MLDHLRFFSKLLRLQWRIYLETLDLPFLIGLTVGDVRNAMWELYAADCAVIAEAQLQFAVRRIEVLLTSPELPGLTANARGARPR